MKINNTAKIEGIAENRQGKRTWIVTAFLVLCTLFCITAQAQDVVLDEDSAAAFVEELTTDLKVAVRDKDYVNEIMEMWESRELAGKTKRQAIGILIADVNEVVDDPKIASRLRIKWLAKLTLKPQTSPTPSISTPIQITGTPIQITGTPIPITPPIPSATPQGNKPLTVTTLTWNPLLIPKGGGTMICSANNFVSLTGCGTTKADWVGKHKLNLKCEKGFYDPIWGGTCWDFPTADGNGTWVRGTTEVTADDAVWRAPKESFSRAVKVKKTFLAGECPAGTFWDGFDLGGCWKCPDSYPRRTGNHVADANACASPINETAKAVFLNYNGCPKPDPGAMGLTGKRMPGKPFLDVGGGGCYTCPNSDEEGNILVTDRNTNSVNGEQGCTIRLKWKSPVFPEPGMSGLAGIKDILIENMVLDNPDILTFYLTEEAKSKGYQPGTPGSLEYVKQQWQEIGSNPYKSKALSNLMFGFLEVAILTDAQERTPAEKKLVAAVEDYMRLRRTFIAEQALGMYDAWKTEDDKRKERRANSQLLTLFDYGTVPLDFHSAALAGFGLGSTGASTVGVIVGFNKYGVAVAKLSKDVAAAARNQNVSVEIAVRAARDSQSLYRGFNSLKGFRALSVVTSLSTIGPAILIEVAGGILISIAIEQFIKIMEARPKLLAAVDMAKLTVKLEKIYAQPDGKDQLTYFWSKAMDVKTIQEDSQIVTKARAAMEQAKQRGYQLSSGQ